MISNKPISAKSAWLTHIGWNAKAKLRLFCFPHSGAGASTFYKWMDKLPPAIEVCPVQYPGRENRMGESLYTRLSELVEALGQGILPYLNKPFAFFGHSMGALVSFELARYLRHHHNLKPEYLFVSGHNAPQIKERKRLLHILPDSEFIEEIRQLNGTPEAVLKHPELKNLVVPLLRADFEVCETYQYQNGAPLACPISALGGLRDDYVNRKGLEAWAEQTTAVFSTRMFPGDHFYLNSNQMLLLRTLAKELVAL